MAKDILLYGTIYQYSAMFFASQITEATEENPEEELVLRVNCDGGSPEYGMSVIEKVQEMSEQFYIKVGAMAHSMALFLLCYLDKKKVECIDTTQAVLHRAAWPEWIESQSSFLGSIYHQILVKTNKDLEKAFRAAVNVEILEALPQFAEKNITLKDIFSLESRVEVLLTANDLKKIGLVSKITKITPTKAVEMAAQLESFKKCTSLSEFKLAAQATPEVIEKPKNKIMTLDELKAQYPAVYAQVKAEGHAEGITAEKDRVESIMVFNEIDPAGVKAAIEAGKPLTAKQMSEFSLKSFSKQTLDAVKKDSMGNVITEELPLGEGGKEAAKEKNMAEFEGKLGAVLGLSAAKK
jgi:ATP-dependent protease ClpP protease subunit